jgi:H+/Cl- antiporter ClcA
VIVVSDEEPTLKASYYRLMVYAALFGALSLLLTAGYITFYNQGIIFFGQVSFFIYNINFWPLILLGLAGVSIGLAIKFFGQHGGLGVAQRQYAQTGRLDYRHLPSLILQGFIALWSGAAVGPEGTLVFLTGGFGSFVSERLSAIAGAFGGFFGSPIVGAVGAIEYMFIKELNLYRHLVPGLIAASVGYGIYFALLHTSYLGVYDFPDFASLRVIDLGWALLVEIIAGLVGVLFKIVCVGVLAGMAGAACAFLPLPLTMALLLGFFGGQTDLVPVIVIGAVTGFVISKAFTPLLQKHTAQPASSTKQ